MCMPFVIGLIPSASAEMGCSPNDAAYFTSFLNNPPTSDELSRVPSGAKDIVIAKVRNVSSHLLYGRHGERYWDSPSDVSFGAEMVITEVLSGNPVEKRTMMGPRYYAFYGRSGCRHMDPITPLQKALEYFVVSYGSDDQWRRLVEFPISKEKFEEWDDEVRVWQRERGRPGAKD
jgi:hypothetical protein